jgi:hypothetical protein
MTGDFILTHGFYFFSRLIQFGQALRYPLRYAYYNHAALVIEDDGTLAEALSRGVVRTHISAYDERFYYHVPTGWLATPHDREQIRAFACDVLAKRERYGWLTLASVSVALLTGSTIQFARNGTAICSGFVAEALRPAGYNWAKSAPFMLPADLAKEFRAL